MKRALRWVAIVVAVLLVVAGGFWYSIFGKNEPIVDGQILAPGVETVKDEFVSSFLIDVGSGKFVLVDAGNDKLGKPILAALARKNLTPSAVTAILLTHGHPDHTAGIKLFSDAQVYAMQDEVALIGDAAKVTHPLHDGDAFDIGDLHVEAFGTPGHTDGSAVYLARGVLFFGDSAGANKDGTVMQAVRFFSKNPDQNVASLKALTARLQPRASEIHELAFAHSGPLVGFAPLAAFAARP